MLAVDIVAAVDALIHKLANEIAVAAMQLNAIESGLVGAYASIDELLGQRLDFAQGQLTARYSVIQAVFIGADMAFGADNAGMMDLNDGFCALFVDGMDQAGQAFDVAVIPDAQLSLAQLTAVCHAGSFDDDQAGTAGSQAGIVGEPCFVGIFIIGVHDHRRHDHAVFDLGIADFEDSNSFI